MSNITPTNNLPLSQTLATSQATNGASAGTRGVNGGAVTDGWFSDNLANAPLIDVAPPAHLRNLSNQELANEVLQHIMQ